MIRSCLLLVLAAFVLPTTAQSYIAWTEVAVTDNDNEALSNAWAGGLNCPQFSRVDIDGDGLEDLVAFDRKGDVPLVFQNTGSGGADAYRVAPSLHRRFPKLYGWAVLRDLNCDGAEELITSREGQYVVVYAGNRNSGDLRFTVDTNRLTYERAGFTFLVGVTGIDIPAFEDVDGDGDRDILTFNPGGGYVEYFRNRADENGDPCGPLDFVFADSCWGGFYESGIAPSVDLGVCGPGRPSAEGRSGVHAGSTFAAFDADDDADLDLILGDLSFENLVFLENGGTTSSANMVFQDPTYPSDDVPYAVNQFPAPFVLDVDGDGREDLLVAPSSEVQGRGTRQVWYYRNVSASGAYDFERQDEAYLVSDMPDFGHGASPVFFDHNGDGLLDMVVGNEGYLPAIGNKVSQLALMENIGTASEPAFKVLNSDYGGLSLFGFEAIYPTFGDVDGDGDLDLIVGEEDGLLHLFANNPVGGEASFSLLTPGWQGIDVGKTSTPQLVDLDRDGDLDLLIGEKNGNLNHYDNIGTASAPDMSLVSDNFGAIAPLSGTTNVGYSQPFVVERPGSAGYRLYVGALNGRIWQYDNWEGDLSASFPAADSAVGNIDDGERCRVAAADLNDDGKLELVTGNQRGGLVLYREGSYPNAVYEPEVWPLRVFPNPATTLVRVEADQGSGLLGEVRWDAFDAMGRRVAGGAFRGSGTDINTSNWSPGLYLLNFSSAEGQQRMMRVQIVRP